VWGSTCKYLFGKLKKTGEKREKWLTHLITCSSVQAESVQRHEQTQSGSVMNTVHITVTVNAIKQMETWIKKASYLDNDV
jgi:hypothetical protein